MNTNVKSAKIINLCSAPHFRDEVVRQNHDEWADTIDMDFKTMSTLFSVDQPDNVLPVTLIALIDDRYAGCGSLREAPLGVHKYPEAYHDDKPWLSNLWVAEWARGQKLATRLVAAIEDEVRRLGFKAMYISTFVENSLYDQMGYKEVSNSFLKDKPLRSLRRAL
ncbi:MAG: GNAT family N-acetyltransferase [Pseudomonadota bacterium]